MLWFSNIVDFVKIRYLFAAMSDFCLPQLMCLLFLEISVPSRILVVAWIISDRSLFRSIYNFNHSHIILSLTKLCQSDRRESLGIKFVCASYLTYHINRHQSVPLRVCTHPVSLLAKGIQFSETLFVSATFSADRPY